MVTDTNDVMSVYKKLKIFLCLIKRNAMKVRNGGILHAFVA